MAVAPLVELARDDVLRRTHLSRSRVKPVSEIEAERIHDQVVGRWEIEDWKHPDYQECISHRAAVLAKIRADKTGRTLSALKLFYKLNPADFINDWGYTTDPRNPEVGLPTYVPFILFPKQREWVDFILRKWRAREPGLTEKSRDCGLSWLAVALGSTLCLFYTGLVIGYGSRKAEYVDKRGQPKTLFWKAREFMKKLPEEFRGGWRFEKDAPLMRLTFPQTESTMSGEGGDNIGRGDRTSIFFVDEHAYLEHSESVDSALSQTTNCQQDISSVHGMANAFAVKRHSGKVEVFVFDHRDDPRKDLEWYEKQKAELDEVTVAQEIDRDYSASVEGILIPSKWVRSAIDAHVRLKLPVEGKRAGALDLADEGRDKNAFCGAHGVVIEYLEEWSGKGGDLFATAERAFALCDDLGYQGFRWDADGLGASLRGDARVLNEKRRGRPVLVTPFRGSEGVWQPDNYVPGSGTGPGDKGILNKDKFANRKAQAFWALRERFRKTYRWVEQDKPCKPDEIISISSKCQNWQKLVTELSQPTTKDSGAGKLTVNKAPDGAPSPNLADAVMMRFAPMDEPLNITPDVLSRVAQMRRHRRR